MGNLIRYYNQNRKKIWGFIIIIAFAFLVLQTANFFAKKGNDKKIEQSIINSTISEKNTNQEDNIQNNEYTENKVTSKKDVIEEFVSYCNKKDLESAYNMLTEECKEQMFSDLDSFEKIYYNSTFENENKECDINNWSKNTYAVTFTKNALATGKIAKNKEDQKIDYITVIEDNDNNYKLNINSYIGYKEIKTTKEENDIKMEVIGRHTYMNYEIYTVNIINNTEKELVLGKLDNEESIYLKDSNNVKYPVYSNELTDSMVTVSKGHRKQLNFKFYSSYVSTKKIKQIAFSELRTNNEQIEFIINL